MKTLENLNLDPYAIEVEINGVTHNVLPDICLNITYYNVDISGFVPTNLVLVENIPYLNQIFKNGVVELGSLHMGFMHTCDNTILRVYGETHKLIDFYQKMVGNKLVITLTPKQYLDLFTFDIAYEIVPK